MTQRVRLEAWGRIFAAGLVLSPAYASVAGDAREELAREIMTERAAGRVGLREAIEIGQLRYSGPTGHRAAAHCDRIYGVESTDFAGRLECVRVYMKVPVPGAETNLTPPKPGPEASELNEMLLQNGAR